jgi:hypothetical protein
MHNPNPTTSGVGRFDSTGLGATVGGVPIGVDTGEISVVALVFCGVPEQGSTVSFPPFLGDSQGVS